jgi:hypothetical protein
MSATWLRAGIDSQLQILVDNLAEASLLALEPLPKEEDSLMPLKKKNLVTSGSMVFDVVRMTE